MTKWELAIFMNGAFRTIEDLTEPDSPLLKLVNEYGISAALRSIYAPSGEPSREELNVAARYIQESLSAFVAELEAAKEDEHSE